MISTLVIPYIITYLLAPMSNTKCRPQLLLFHELLLQRDVRIVNHEPRPVLCRLTYLFTSSGGLFFIDVSMIAVTVIAGSGIDITVIAVPAIAVIIVGVMASIVNY